MFIALAAPEIDSCARIWRRRLILPGPIWPTPGRFTLIHSSALGVFVMDAKRSPDGAPLAARNRTRCAPRAEAALDLDLGREHDDALRRHAEELGGLRAAPL